MSLLQEIQDKGATAAWCPVENGKPLIALGAKDAATGDTFDDYGGELDLYKMDMAAGEMKLLQQTQTTTRFNCLAWGAKGPGGLGIIAGGMQNGTISVWDPASLSQPLAQIEKHKSAVNSLQFNPHAAKADLLATGASDNEVYIVDVSRPSAPNVYSPAGPGCRKHSAEVKAVAWNTEVVHVLATASLDATCTVWSLKAKKPWAEIRDPNGAGFSAIAWSPAQGLHLLTASNDDRDPVIRLWDVRSSTTNPLAEYRGHRGGILSVSWCPADPSFVLSCGKDNRTLLWDLYTSRPVAELSNKREMHSEHHQSSQGHHGGGMHGGFGANTSATAAFGGSANGLRGANNVFEGPGGLGGANTGRRYQIAFSPHHRTIFSACTFDRKVQILSLNGACGGVDAARSATNSQPPYKLRAPKWMMRKCGGVFGFGGKFVSFGSKQGSEGRVRILQVREEEKVVQKCIEWEYQMQTAFTNGMVDPARLRAICGDKASAATLVADRENWKSIQVLFEESAREKILEHIGFAYDEINQLLSAYDTSTASPVQASPQLEEQYESTAPEIHHIQNGPDSGWQSQSQQPGSQIPPESHFQQHQQQQFDTTGVDPSQVFGAMNGEGGASAFDAFEDFDNEPSGEATEGVPETETAGKPPEEQQQPPGSPEPSFRAQPASASSPTLALGEEKKTRIEDVAIEDAETRNPELDDLIGKALMVGNFNAAVNLCLEKNRFSDALLISSCSGNELWQSAVDRYLERFYDKKPYVQRLEAIMKADFEPYVQKSDISGDKWKEVMAVVSQFAKSDQVPPLFEVLASRLETGSQDELSTIAACFCYVAAKNVEKTIDLLEKQVAEVEKTNGLKGRILLSQSIVEKTQVFMHALDDPSAVLALPNVMAHYVNYSTFLASQGLLEYAANYIASVDTSKLQPELHQETDMHGNPIQVEHLSEFGRAHNEQADRALLLQDRIYNSDPNPQYGTGNFISGPVMAFQIQNIGVAPSNTPYVPELQAHVPEQTHMGDYQNQGYHNHHHHQQQQQQLPQQNQPHPYTKSGDPFQQPPAGGGSMAPPIPPQQHTQQSFLPQQSTQHQFQPPPPQQQQQQYMGFQQHQPPPQAPPMSSGRPSTSSAPSYIKENDGFGSTAGNPAAGEKYGNYSPNLGAGVPPQNMQQQQQQQPQGIFNPNQVQQAPQAAPQVQPPAAPKVMPSQMAPIMQMLDQHMQHLGQRMSTAIEKRKFGEATKTVQLLKDKLMAGSISQDLFPLVTQLVQAICQGDNANANVIIQGLTSRSEVWAEQKEWIKGMRSLTLLNRK